MPEKPLQLVEDPIVRAASPAGGVPSINPERTFPEDALSLPWTTDPATSWIDYRCWVEVLLDPGMALHKPLPQSNPAVDTLASAFITDADFDKNIGGVNLASSSRAVDIIQRMASSTYRFILKGFGLRAGYTIPVPGIRSVGGIPAVPDFPQWTSGNVLVGNWSGIPMFFCEWELHYIVSQSPHGTRSPGNPDAATGPVAAPIPPNPAQHIRGDAELPAGISLPRVFPDGRVVQGVPGNPQGR